MHITRDSIDTSAGPSEWFTGNVCVATIYVEGIGLAQRRDGTIEVIRPGDRVFKMRLVW